MSMKFVTTMQASSAANPVSVQGGTVIQVSPKVSSGSHTIIQQNGQQFILGKMEHGVNEVQNTAETITIQSNGQTVQTVYPVQYIEAAQEQTVYATNNGQIEYIEINSGKPITKILSTTKTENGQYPDYSSNLYGGGGTTYYQTASGQLLTSGSSRLVTHHGNTYLVQGAPLDNDSAQMPHSTRASPVTVQWLIENYQTAEGVSLPRSTLYSHYLRHCHEQKIEPMNPASFGKLIRSVFLGLRTRRLGTRGNSKYHYYGIRIKESSHLNQFVEDQTFAMRHYPHYHKQSLEADYHGSRFKSVCKYESGDVPRSVGAGGLGSGAAGGGMAPSMHPASGSSSNTGAGVSGGSGGALGDEASKHQEFLGDASSALPNLDEICVSAGLDVSVAVSVAGAAAISHVGGKMDYPLGITENDVTTFTKLYSYHCEEIQASVVNLTFSHLEAIWQNFWRTGTTEDSELEMRLPRAKLYLLCQMEEVRNFIRIADHTFYQSLVEVLIPDVLRPIPSTLTQGIRNFAKSLENWMRSATRGLDPEISKLKMSAVAALAQTLRRYTSLNHLAQAARAVLQNSNQIAQMLADLNRVDFTNVQEQASWVCHCDDGTVAQVQQDFKRILQQETSLEHWAGWLDHVVSTVLQPREGGNDFSRAARQFILKWSFYSSMVIRDLTLRSAASFGSFHLIRLLYDEYIYYLVEHKVAAHEGLTPVAVMGDLGKHVFNDDCSVSNDCDPSFLDTTVDETSRPAEPARPSVEPVQGTTESSKTTTERGGGPKGPIELVEDDSPHSEPVESDAKQEPNLTENGSPPAVTSYYHLYSRKTVRVTTGDEDNQAAAHAASSIPTDSAHPTSVPSQVPSDTSLVITSSAASNPSQPPQAKRLKTDAM